MEITDIGNSLRDNLAVHLQHDPKHPMGRWMRRPHIEHHLLSFEVRQLSFVNAIASLSQCGGNPARRFPELNVLYGSHYRVWGDGLSGSCALRISVRRSRREIVSTDSLSGRRTRG